ncbi:uncharacterized protein DFL_000579 [Arthrobotrys flagrans]|uniref:Uncharacterized protein n=1 Tax=Arthrobotrys flagrans TaxID=97331 RepID=A0A437AEQ6_ARTFL|nr:hypothetical protein DFL_000579 [Arthrobotrys flagrans]
MSTLVTLALLPLASKASAYTTPFYGSAASTAGNGILSAAITGDATDNYWGYTARPFSNPACNPQVTTISSDGGCESTGAIRRFVVVGTESNFQMLEGNWDTVSYTFNTVQSIESDAIYNETAKYATTNDVEVSIPGYAVDKNGDGLADGTIGETTTTDPNGNIVSIKQEIENFAGLGALMDGPVVHYDPTLNDPRILNPVLDEGGSGTLTSTGWPAAVLSRE